MNKILIVTKSITNAQKLANIISKNGFFSSVMKTPSDIRLKNCSYSVIFYQKDFNQVLNLLTSRNFENLNLYSYINGSYQKMEGI